MPPKLLKIGIQQGEQKKAVEDAIMLINEYEETPEIAAQKMNAPLKLVLEGLKKTKEKNLNSTYSPQTEEET